MPRKAIDAEPRLVILSVRVSVTERDALDDEAKRRGLTISEVIRDRVFAKTANA